MKRKVSDGVPKPLRHVQSRSSDPAKTSGFALPHPNPRNRSDSSCRIEVKFKIPKAGNRGQPRIDSDDANTSEYAFFKKSTEDACRDHCACSGCKEGDRGSDSKPRSCSRERIHVVRSSVIKKDAIEDVFEESETRHGLERTRAHSTSEDIDRKQKCMVEETGNTLKPEGKGLNLFEEIVKQDGQTDVFDRKRRKLLQLVREISFPEIDGLCSNGSSLVSFLLSRLIPKSESKNVKNPELPDEKSMSDDSKEDSSYTDSYKKGHGTLILTVVTKDQIHSLADGRTVLGNQIICGNMQKLFVISGRLVATVSGTIYEGAEFLQHLQTEAKETYNMFRIRKIANRRLRDIEGEGKEFQADVQIFGYMDGLPTMYTTTDRKIRRLQVGSVYGNGNGTQIAQMYYMLNQKERSELFKQIEIQKEEKRRTDWNRKQRDQLEIMHRKERHEFKEECAQECLGMLELMHVYSTCTEKGVGGYLSRATISRKKKLVLSLPQQTHVLQVLMDHYEDFIHRNPVLYMRWYLVISKHAPCFASIDAYITQRSIPHFVPIDTNLQVMAHYTDEMTIIRVVSCFDDETLPEFENQHELSEHDTMTISIENLRGENLLALRAFGAPKL